MERAKVNWDERILKNEKMQEIISDIKSSERKSEKNKANFEKKNKVTNLVIE